MPIDKNRFRMTPSYPGQMPTGKTKSGASYYRIEDGPRKTTRQKVRVYIIKGGRLGSWRGYDEAEAKRHIEKYGGRLSSKTVTQLS